MAPITTMFCVAIVIALASVGGLIASAIAYMRAAKTLAYFVLENGPNLWTDIISQTKYSGTASIVPDFWIYRLLLGLTTLNISNPLYEQKLWAARKLLIICAIFWMIGISAVAWAFH